MSEYHWNYSPQNMNGWWPSPPGFFQGQFPPQVQTFNNLIYPPQSTTQYQPSPSSAQHPTFPPSTNSNEITESQRENQQHKATTNVALSPESEFLDEDTSGFSPTSLLRGRTRAPDHDMTPNTRRRTLDQRNLFNKFVRSTLKKHDITSLLQRRKLQKVFKEVEDAFPTLNTEEGDIKKRIKRDLLYKIHREKLKNKKSNENRDNTARQLFQEDIDTELVLTPGKFVLLTYKEFVIAKACIVSYPCVKEDFPEDQRENFAFVCLVHLAKNSKVIVKEVPFDKRPFDRIGKGYSVAWQIQQMRPCHAETSVPNIQVNNGQMTQKAVAIKKQVVRQKNKTVVRQADKSTTQSASTSNTVSASTANMADVIIHRTDEIDNEESADIPQVPDIQDMAIERSNEVDEETVSTEILEVPNIQRFQAAVQSYNDVYSENGEIFESYIRAFSGCSRTEPPMSPQRSNENDVLNSSGDLQVDEEIVSREITDESDLMDLPVLTKPKSSRKNREKDKTKSKVIMEKNIHVGSRRKDFQVGDFVKAKVFDASGTRFKVYCGQIKKIENQEVEISFMADIDNNKKKFPKKKDIGWTKKKNIIQILQEPSIQGAIYIFNI